MTDRQLAVQRAHAMPQTQSALRPPDTAHDGACTREITLTVARDGTIGVQFNAAPVNVMRYQDWHHWFTVGISAYAEGDRLRVRALTQE